MKRPKRKSPRKIGGSGAPTIGVHVLFVLALARIGLAVFVRLGRRGLLFADLWLRQDKGEQSFGHDGLLVKGCRIPTVCISFHGRVKTASPAGLVVRTRPCAGEKASRPDPLHDHK